MLVAHLNKMLGADPLQRTGGSIGIPAAVRSALLLARDPADHEGERGRKRVLAHFKCNIAQLAPSLSYEVEPIILPDGSASTARMKLLGESEQSGTELLSVQVEQGSAMEEALDFLQAELSEGERPAREVKKTAREVGVSDRTLDRAKKELGVKVSRAGEAGKRGGSNPGRPVERVPIFTKGSSGPTDSIKTIDPGSPVREILNAELAKATAELKAHMATWEYAFAMAGGCHGGRDHPVHWETHARTERLAARCSELRARLAEHEL